MRSIKINKNIVDAKRKTLPYITDAVTEVKVNSPSVRGFIITFVQQHGLTTGDKIVMTLNRENYPPAVHDFSVIVITDKKIQVNIPKFTLLNVKSYGGDILTLNSGYVFDYIRDHNNISIESGDIQITGSINVNTDNEEDATSEAILCDKSVDFDGDGTVRVLNDWYLINNEDNETFFNSDITIEDRRVSLDISLMLEDSTAYNLDDEQAILNGYLKDVERSIIPEVVDNEKRQFTPVILSGKTSYYATELVFNLHFRDRLDSESKIREGWKTSDEQYWNLMQKFEGGNINSETDDYLKYTVKGYDDSYGDELKYLGFTEDDIKYSKTKVKKSFIRLMFYSSRNLMSKELLFYSTIFFDVGELFQKYVDIKSRGLECFDDSRIDKNLRLSATLKVKNQYNTSKSSEGFYLYLFPQGIGNEKDKTDIYMKVEFNHAGYGKTVPMMLPTATNGKSVIKTSSRTFPLNFMKKDGEGKVEFDFETYQRYMMIPIQIWKDSVLKNYVYTFPFVSNTNKIELNLFEPRIRGFEA